MAVFSGALYGQAMLHLARKRADLLGDNIVLRLHTSLYVPDKDLHDFQDDLTAELATGGGYTAGGVSLANKTVTYDAAADTTIFDADDVSIANSTLTWRVATFSDSTPGLATTNPLLSYQVGDVDTVSSGGTTTITMPATGILRFTT
jgi:hypothetical protein